MTDIFNEFDWRSLLFERIWLAELSIVRQKKKSQRWKFKILYTFYTILYKFCIYMAYYILKYLKHQQGLLHKTSQT